MGPDVVDGQNGRVAIPGIEYWQVGYREEWGDLASRDALSPKWLLLDHGRACPISTRLLTSTLQHHMINLEC